ncbi:phage tail tape measure protein [Providencia stuartii]|uniref:phage tail tape measure protein n=1 Tax=Providencia stuartii TaxID=588 RepID=UPI002AA0CB61|nr:phage tail tape measure protein [Providencia stuartii]
MPGSGRSSAYKVDAGTRLDEENQKALTSLQAQLKVLKEHKTVSDVISSERKKLWDMEAKISVLEEAKATRKLTKDEQALLAKKEIILESQKALAVAGDAVELQKQHNRELDRQLKRVEEINARSRALELGAGKSGRMYQRDIALEKAKSPDERKALEEYYAKEDSIRADWELGVKKGFAEFQEQATDVYGNVSQISQSAFQGMSNSLSDFVLTGKANFADFTRSFLEMTTKMLMQMAMLNAMKAAFGGTVVGNFLGLKGHSEGGYTGDGGKYQPMGIVHGGEFVFTKEATQRLGIANLYRLMDYGQKGYASGGYVGGSAPMSVTQPTAFIARNPQIAGGGTNININMGDIKLDNGGQIQQSQSNQMNTNAVKREFQQMIEVGVNNLLKNPASALSRTIKGN